MRKNIFKEGIKFEKGQQFSEFLDKLNISLNKKEINGKLRYLLPSLIPEMLANKKVVINVYTEEWSDGRGYHKIPVARLSHLQQWNSMDTFLKKYYLC